jgi:hypothetical protein
MEDNMALYRCNHPNCPGHDNFFAACPRPRVQDYAPLHSFIQLLETQPMEAIVVEPAPDNTPSGKATDYFNFWREE